MKAAIEVTSGEYRVEIVCPHIEGGACGPCVAAGVMEFVGARQALDQIIPVLRQYETLATNTAQHLGSLAKWAETQAARKWQVVDAPAGDAGGRE